MQDMTSGKITPQLIRFAFPLVLGNVFQLLYNAADSVIVGRLVGKEALAAVGTANPVMNIVIFLLAGVCMGASILMSEFFGAGDTENLQKEISTSLLSGCTLSLIITILGWFLAGTILRWIHTPEDIMREATLYLQIIFLGMIFTYLYNFYANTLRALGDSVTPLLFLTLSAGINVGADLLFVAVFRMGVTGCAIATVLAQGISCLCCGIYIHRKVPMLHLGAGWFFFEPKLFGKTVRYSWFSAAQQATLYIGKLLVQMEVNTLGINAMAAFQAVNRVDDFAFMPQQNIGHAMTTFLAQNRGAGKEERLRKGLWTGLKIEGVYGLCLMAVCSLGAQVLMRIFVTDSQVVDMGTGYLRIIAFLYFLPGLTNGIQGFFRGMGKLNITFFSTVINIVGRVVAVFLLIGPVGFMGTLWGNLTGWLMMLLFEVPLLGKEMKKRRKVA